MFYTMNYDSPIGPLTLASDGENLIGLWMDAQKYFAATIAKEEVDEVKGADLPVLSATCTWLDDYFAGQDPSIEALPLAPQGGEFRRMVWDLLCDIPYGEVTTYGEIARTIARRLGKQKMASQAVGGAVGHNPISIIIPCHRVVGASGSLTGYGGGMARKIFLLKHEGLDMSRFTIPTKGTAL